MKKYTLLSFLLLFPLSVFALDKSFTIDGNIMYGSVSGYTQIPTGGSPSSSDAYRPTFNELGINNNFNYNLGAILQLDNWEIFANYQFINLSSTTVLEQDLLTRDTFLPAGTSVEDVTSLNWGKAGIMYDFKINKWTLSPIIDTAMLNFKYALNVAPSRAFTEVAVRVGGQIIYNVTSNFYIKGNITTSIPCFNLIITDGALTFNYKFPTKYVTPTIYVGGAYTYINFEDSQDFPNHILYRSPEIISGIALTF